MASQEQNIVANVINLKELTLENKQTCQSYTLLVPDNVYKQIHQDGADILSGMIFNMVVSMFTINGHPKEKTLDYTESLKVLTALNLLQAAEESAKDASNVTIGKRTIFDPVSTTAYSKELSDETLQKLCELAPRTFSPRQKVRYMEVLAAAMPEGSSDSEIRENSSTQIATEPEEESVGDGRTSWSHEAVLLLIESKRELTHLFESNTTTQKQAWRKVAEALKDKGYTFSEDDCSKKFRSLRGRYIAIIHPIKAHIICNRRRIVVVLGCIWPFAFAAGLPTLFFNRVRPGHTDHPESTIQYCMIMFPDNPNFYFMIYKLLESFLFYFLPLTIQLTLYAFVSKHLFIGSDRLHRTYTVRDSNGTSMERYSEAIQARKGVVKMLMVSVIVYFLSYSPNQVLLLWNTLRPQTFHENWAFLVFTMVVAYINSAANPVLYSIFSQNFRECFRNVLCHCCCPKQPPRRTLRAGSSPSTYNTYSTTTRYWRHTSLASAVTEV